MQLPKRPPNHVLETASWKLLQAAIPLEWILREVTERDYGIDAYLELVTKEGFVTGDLVSLQVKGKGQLAWKGGMSSFPGIRKETINYWMNLPVPVFLCVADVGASRVWFVDVKDHVRRAYKDFQAQKTLTFPLLAECVFDNQEGLSQFLRAYERERRHERVALDVIALLANCSTYAAFCDERLHRDRHLNLQPQNAMVFAHLHGIAQSVAQHLGLGWKLKSVEDLLSDDQRKWNGGIGDLHEATIFEFIETFRPKLAEIIEAARRYVASDYSEFWRATNPLLHRSCNEHSEYSYVINQAVEDLRKSM